jgi:aspartokinase
VAASSLFVPPSQWLQSSPRAQSAHILVVTGYIATTSTGTPTTLGRDGSDYSASIFAALLEARSVTIWTDVDGVYSANPAQVRSAIILPEMSYDEASELAYFGAKVLHPKTMTPVVMHNIPVWIRNTFNAAHPGSCIISAKSIAQRERDEAKSLLKKSPSMDTVVGYGVRGFSEISNLSLLIVEGTGNSESCPVFCTQGALQQMQARECGLARVSSHDLNSTLSLYEAVPLEKRMYNGVRACLQLSNNRARLVAHSFVHPSMMVASEFSRFSESIS